VKVIGREQEIGARAERNVPTRSLDERRKQMKRTVSQALLKALGSLTGIRQPWGILTGVRPTKLWHQAVQRGFDDADIRRHIAAETMVAPEKLDLMQTIVKRQRETIPDLYELKQAVSIYVGIPFCPTKCAYCTF